MFGSKKSNETRHLNNSTLPRINDTYNGLPKVTSTPLHSPSIHRRNSSILSPSRSHYGGLRRYSLSDITSPTNKLSTLNKSQQMQGPLLASVNYKDSISLYEETKSSGLAERIVAYNKEAEHETEPTHQEKYKGPGLFPIVHLFKEKPPVLQQSLKRVKIKLSNSDFLKHSPVQCSSRIPEGITKSRFKTHLSYRSNSESGTKSVLDALKEISRKRIHSSEDYDLNEDSGKRLRTELHNGATPNPKRNRGDSTASDTSLDLSPKQTQKKICMYDEYAASKSSSDFSFLKKSEPTLTKRKTISTSTENLKEPKQIKLINVETQTIPVVEESKVKETDSSKQDETDTKTNADNAVNVFNNNHLENIRKNRLAALMGNLVGKKPNVSPDQIEEDKDKEESKDVTDSNTTSSNNQQENVSVVTSSSKPLTSILSPPKTANAAVSTKPEKHVYFNLPITSAPTSNTHIPITQTSTSIITPIISSSESKNAEVTKIPSILSTPSVSNTQVPSPSLQFSFGKPAMSTLASGTVQKEETTLLQPSSEISKQNSPAVSDKSKLTSPIGGFKFDLKAPSSNPKEISSNVLPSTPSSLNVSQSALVSSPSSGFSNSLTHPKPIASFTFDSKNSGSQAVAVANATFSFGKPTETKPDNNVSLGLSLPINAGIGSKNESGKSNASASFSFQPVENKNQPSFNFGSASVSTASSAAPNFNFQVTKSPTFNFGSSPKTAGETKISQPSLPATTSFGFGGKTDNISKFGSAVSSSQPIAPPFGLPKTTNAPAFGFSALTNTTTLGSNAASTTFSAKPGFQISDAASSFGNSVVQTTVSAAPTSSSFAFGSNSIAKLTPTSKPFNFTAPTSSSIFGANQVQPTSNKPVNETPLFGGASTGFKSSAAPAGSVFGSVPSTSAPVFGTAAAASSVFGSTSAPHSVFGATPASSSSVFGNAGAGFGSTTVTSASTFGSDVKPLFGTANVFGSANMPPPYVSTTSAAPAFGSAPSAPPAYGSAPSAAPAFGSTTSAVPAFGSSTTAAPAFGSSTTVAPAFGSAPSTAPAFGSSTPTKTAFGSSSAATSVPPFGSGVSSAFGTITTTTTTPSFGFGSKSTFTFGGSNDNKNAAAVFGSAPGGSAFGKPATAHNGFGGGDKGFNASSTGAFGNPTASGFGSAANSFGSGNAFGTSGSTQNTGGFNFGATPAASSGPFAVSETPKPTFNFTAGTSAPTFGSNNNPSAFGAPPSNFGATASTFGPTGPTTPGVFNIGSGPASTNRNRPQLRGKRRT